MTIAEEKAAAYLKAKLEDYAYWGLDGGPWTDESITNAYVAGYAAAERYRLILQAAIRNATPQIEADLCHDD